MAQELKQVQCTECHAPLFRRRVDKGKLPRCPLCRLAQSKQRLADFKLANPNYWAEYRARNREQMTARCRDYHARNREQLNAKQRERGKTEHVKQQRRERWAKNREKMCAQRKARKDKYLAYERERYSNDPSYRIARRLRGRLRAALHCGAKTGSAVSALGCTIEYLRLYIEGKFLPGMTWDNWSRYGWWIDHIRPLASFDLEDPAQMAIACHYTNLQPMWATDNIKKGAKWDG